ncbi:DUF1120 domain-containing protein [Lonsdalea quercina]
MEDKMPIKKIAAVLSISSSVLLCGNAYSAMNINVHGIIAPNACIATIVGGDNLDWGITQHARLKQKSLNNFPAKKVTLQFNCPSDQSVAFWATDPNQDSALVGENIDGRTGHADVNRIFGLGFDPVTGNKLGNFTLNPVSTTVDGITNDTSFGYMVSGAHNGTAFGRVLTKSWAYKKTEDYTPWNETTNKPAVGKSFSWVFDIEPQLNNGEMITNAEQVDWQGTAQVNVRYF